MSLEYPDSLTPELKEVLSLMLFDTGPAAQVLREAGVCPDLVRRPEAEQAYILDMGIRLVLEYGPEWRNEFSKFLRPYVEMAKKVQELKQSFKN